MILLRSALYNCYFWFITAMMAIASLPIRFFFPRAALAYGRIWVRALLAGLPLVGIRILVTGTEHLPRSGPALIASQHQSAFDTLVWLTLLPRPAYVLKQELLRLPLFGPMVRPAGQIPIDRAGGAAAIRVLLAEADRAIAEGRQIIIFPEGTRVPPGQVGRLHPGVAALARHTGLSVIPVLTDSGRLWGRRGFRKRPGTIRIAIQPPCPAGTDRRALLACLNRLYAASAQLVDNSVESCATGFPRHGRNLLHSPD